ncbi:MAG: hypothetical protein KKC46_14860 [Proteobacteria bacterium]|nr:hypothetical protein [Pseudomonadota bacterium]
MAAGKKVHFFVFLIIVLWIANPVLAHSDDRLLLERIEQLDREVQELKALLLQQQEAQQETSTRIKKIESTAQAPVSEAADPDSEKTRFKFEPYGFIKLDAAYDDSRTDFGNFALYVPNESGNKNDNEFNMTARQTRLGLNILAPTNNGWNAKGQVEFDFYGSATHENKADPMLRHAFVEINKDNFSLIAGQTSDLISPLYPTTLNYTVLWSAGNIGYRRPQLRLTHTHPFDEKNKLLTAIAISKTDGTVNEDFDLDGQNDGEDAGFPTIQGRVAISTTAFSDRPYTFGISGHYGKKEIDFGKINTGSREKKLKSWSVNGDLTLPLTEQLSVKGEIFLGAALDDYFGGILQGINRVSEDEIKAIGGWLQLSYQYDNQLRFNTGFGIDDPENDDRSTEMREKNSAYYANVLFKPFDPLEIGLEYSFWDTQHKGKSSGTANRLQTSVIYKW